MDTTNLSIIIPSYNASSYLERCLDSIRAYAQNDVEIIVVDDGSTDNTFSLLLRYQQMHHEFRLITFHQTNQGVSVARNNGLKHANGKFISFVDADDQLESDWYQKISPFFTSRFNIVSFRTVTLQNNHSSVDQTIPYGKLSPSKVRELYCSSGALNSVCSKLISTEYIKRSGVEFKRGLSMGEDALFLGQLVQKNASLFQSNEILYRYISNPNSSTHTTTCLDYDPSLILMKYHLSSQMNTELQIKSHIFLFNSFISSIRTAIRNGRVSWQELQQHVPHYWQSTQMKDICDGIKPYLDFRRRTELYLVSHNNYRLLRDELSIEIFLRDLLNNH